MRAGTLNKRAVFQRFTSTSDGAGGAIRTWTDFATVWAQFSPERARERIQQGRLASAQAGVLRIRSSSVTRQIDDTFRVVLDGAAMNIRSAINPDQRNDMIEFSVETDGAAG